MKKAPLPDNTSYDSDAKTITVTLENGSNLELNSNHITESGFSRGPGGQNANKSNKGVYLRCEIPENILNGTRDAVNGVLGKILETSAMPTKSKKQNRKAAYKQLALLVAEHFHADAERKPTKISDKKKKKREEKNRRHSQKKKDRKNWKMASGY